MQENIKEKLPETAVFVAKIGKFIEKIRKQKKVKQGKWRKRYIKCEGTKHRGKR